MKRHYLFTLLKSSKLSITHVTNRLLLNSSKNNIYQFSEIKHATGVLNEFDWRLRENRGPQNILYDAFVTKKI